VYVTDFLKCKFSEFSFLVAVTVCFKHGSLLHFKHSVDMNRYRVLVGKPEGKNHWRDLGVDGWIILGRNSRRWDVGIWTGLGWPRIETGGGRL